MDKLENQTCCDGAEMKVHLQDDSSDIYLKCPCCGRVIKLDTKQQKPRE